MRFFAFLLLFFSFWGCNMLDIALLPPSQEGESTSQDATSNDPTQPPDDIACPPLTDAEAVVFQNPPKNEWLFSFPPLSQRALQAIQNTLPATWRQTPNPLWADAKGSFALSLSLPQGSLPREKFFLRVGTWCREASLSLDAAKQRARFLNPLALPACYVGQQCTLRFSARGERLEEGSAYASTSNPKIAQIEQITMSFLRSDSFIDVEINALAQGEFSLLLFGVGFSSFSASLRVD